MYALVRQLSVKPGHTVSAHDREEAEAIARTMRGRLGQLTIDIGEGRYIRIAVWASAAERATNTGSEAPAVGRADDLYFAHLDMPIIGQGEVVSNTLIVP